MSAAIYSLFERVPRRIPPAEVIRFEYGGNAKQGKDLRVSWRTRKAREAHLDIRQKELVLFSGNVPLNGSVTVPILTPDDIETELTVDNHAGVTETNKFLATPKAAHPRARIRIPSKIWLGESILVSWRARRATGVGVEVETTDGTQQRIGKPVDAFLLTPAKAGQVIFRFFLKGQHTTIFDTRVVNVVARKPYITVE
jgi:hypothetical protein